MNGVAVRVLIDPERDLEHVALPEAPAEPRERFAPTRGQPQRGRVEVGCRAELQPPDPGDDVAPVVEVKVRDRDRVDDRPPLRRTQARQHSRPAVEQQPPPGALDEVAGLSAAGVRPRG